MWLIEICLFNYNVRNKKIKLNEKIAAMHKIQCKNKNQNGVFFGVNFPHK